MILLTDISFFFNERELPNVGESGTVAGDASIQKLNGFIRKYEPRILQDVLGYDLATALQAALLSGSQDARWNSLLFGAVYKDSAGNNRQWLGLIETDTQSLMLGSNTIQIRQAQFVTAGVTVDDEGILIMPAGGKTFGTADWKGWTPILYKNGISVLQPGVDYTYDINTGFGTLSQANDNFTQGEIFFVQFEIIYTTPLAPSTFNYKLSLMADYTYFYFQRNAATQTAGIGEVKTASSNAQNVGSYEKQRAAWNDMSDRIFSLWDYLNASLFTYPEWNTALPYTYNYGWLDNSWSCPASRYRKINFAGL